MDRLSPEIVSLVVSYILARPKFIPRIYGQASPPKPERGPYTVTRTWQRATEAHTFATIRLKSTELAEFAAIFSDGRRRGLLRELTFVVCLPTHGDSRADHHTNVAAFSDSLRRLLSLLQEWDQDAADADALPRLKLWLCFDYGILDKDGPVDHHFDVSRSSAARRYLESDLTGFPAVRRVDSFRIDVSLGKAPHPSTVCCLAGLFPRLQELNIEYRDPAIKRREMRKEHRIALADGLRELRKLPRLTKLKIIRQGGWDPSNHSFAAQDLEDEEHVDVLCESIRQLAEVGKLTELELKDVLVSPDLFRNRRPGAGAGHEEDKPMSALRRFVIEDGILSPSGKWYYTGDPGAIEPDSPGTDFGSDGDASDDSDDDSAESNDEDDDHRDIFVNGERPNHQWRTRPDPSTFDPLVSDMASALHRMPALELGCLDIGGVREQRFLVFIQCAQRGQGFNQPPDRTKCSEIDKMTARCKAWVGVDTAWEVPREAEAKWKEWVGETGKVELGKMT